MQEKTISLKRAQFATGGVDDSGVIRGVSMITAGPAIGHDIEIDEEALNTVLAAALASPGGVRVKLDHSWGVDRIIGVLTNPRKDGLQIRADFAPLQSHPAAAFVRELIAKQPTTCGLSISFTYVPEVIDGKVYPRITNLFSCDLVDMPACNPAGMFTGQPTGQTFQSVCREFVRVGMSQHDAVLKAVHEHPVLYAQYRQRGGEIFEQPAPPKATEDATFVKVVRAAVADGMTQADAVRFAQKNYPKLHAAYVTNGGGPL